jgi:hypothetical protein
MKTVVISNAAKLVRGAHHRQLEDPHHACFIKPSWLLTRGFTWHIKYASPHSFTKDTF